MKSGRAFLNSSGVKRVSLFGEINQLHVVFAWISSFNNGRVPLLVNQAKVIRDQNLPLEPKVNAFVLRVHADACYYDQG